MQENESHEGDIGYIKIQIADLLENAGRMLRNADVSTQSEDIRNRILEVENAIHIFKEKSGISFVSPNPEYQENINIPPRRLIGYKRLGESRAHKSSGYPKKPEPVITTHQHKSDDNTS
jgi:hypothetical protein